MNFKRLSIFSFSLVVLLAFSCTNDDGPQVPQIIQDDIMEIEYQDIDHF